MKRKIEVLATKGNLGNKKDILAKKNYKKKTNRDFSKKLIKIQLEET